MSISLSSGDPGMLLFGARGVAAGVDNRAEWGCLGEWTDEKMCCAMRTKSNSSLYTVQYTLTLTLSNVTRMHSTDRELHILEPRFRQSRLRSR